MTSKNLFYNLQKEDLKRRIWTIALAMLAFFLSYPVVGAMRISTYNDNLSRNKEYIFDQMLRFVGTQNEMTILITVVAAIVCGLSGFYYLHSKKKVDLYHSLPIRRELQFAVNYINGLLIYFIPYIINLVLSFIILQINGYMNIDIFMAAVVAIGHNLLFYSLIYTIVIIAVMLTGNFIVSCLGAGVFLLYGPMISSLKSEYYQTFFSTYYMNRQGNELLFLSPVGIYFDTSYKIHNGESPYGTLVKVLIITLLLLILSVYLYKRRPSEAAGKAMAFGLSRPIIKFLLVIPLSLAGGILFREVTRRGSNGWFIFGLIFSLIITYGIIEIIYNFDIKSVFLHKKQMLGCAGIIAIIACIFQFDLFGYDSYIPSKDKIKTMSIALNGIEENLRYVEIKSGVLLYTGDSEYQLKHMALEDYDASYELARIGVSNVKSSKEINTHFYRVKYTLENGKEVYRSYWASLDETMNNVKDIYENPEFKQGHYPINIIDINEINRVSAYNMLGAIDFSLTEDEKRQLVEIYREELNSLTLEELANSDPIANLKFFIAEHRELDYHVYPTFERTIKFLQEHGFDPTIRIDVEDIKDITVTNMINQREYQSSYKEEVTISTAEYAEKYGEEHASAKYLEKEQIKEIFSVLRSGEYFWNNYILVSVDDSLEVSVTVSADQYGNENTYSFYFSKGMIPDYVKEDVGYIEE